MNIADFLADNLGRADGMLKMTLADFTEAEMLVRPVPGANHTAWQLGHLIVSQQGMCTAVGAKLPELPAGFAERFTAKTAGVDDVSKLSSKAELLELLGRSSAAIGVWARALKVEDLEKPGPEAMRAYAPTVGSLLSLSVGHLMMHMGQMQVIRRKLGKPILF